MTSQEECSLQQFECGCDLIKRTPWDYVLINCMGHSKRLKDGGYQRVVHLTKPIMEDWHP